MSTPFQGDRQIPNLPQRSNNTDRFSTYLMVDSQQGRVVLQWIAEPRLRRNIQRYATHDPNFARLHDARNSEEQLEQFWINLALNLQPIQGWEPDNRQGLAFQHLASYYESICYRAARAIGNQHLPVSWEESLTIARTFVYNSSKLEEILKKYQPKGTAQFSTYLQEVLTRTIKSEASVGRYSCWRLICHTPPRTLVQGLETIHYREPEISQILFAHKLFKQVYLFNRVKNPTREQKKTWPIPKPEDFAKTADCYNTERQLPSAPLEVAANPYPVTPEQIESWMENCFEGIKACKRLENKVDANIKIELTDPNTEANRMEFPLEGESELTSALSKYSPQINQLFETELKRCPDIIELQVSDRIWLIDKAKILPLKYGFGFTQMQIAALCGLKQYNISRKITQYKKPLVQALTQLSQPEGWVSDYIAEWLKKYFPSPDRTDIIQAALVEAFKQLTASEIEVLYLGCVKKMEVSVIGDRLGCSADEVKAKLALIETQLHNGLLISIEKWIKEYVNAWLDDFYQSLVHQVLIQHWMELSARVQEILRIYSKNPVKLEVKEEDLEGDAPEEITLFWEGKCQLERDLIQWMENSLNISMVGNDERHKINQLVEDWLKFFYIFWEGGQDNEV